jgi:gliding motility-associated-like protein
MHTQTLNVQDTTAPIFVETLPANATVECSAIPTAAVLTATDNCGTATVSYNEVKTAGSCVNNYTLARTWTATDQCETSSKYTQIITVQDTIKPVANEMAGSLDKTLQCLDSQEISDALALVPTATDNCTSSPIINLVSDTTTAIATCSYIRVRQWNFIDECGNISLDFIQTIIVEDPTPKTSILATDDTASDADGLRGVKNVLNILTNDFVDAVSATINNLNISIITPDPTGSLVLNTDGSVDVKPGTPAGKYTFVYEICTKSIPKVCDQATVTITVVAPVIIAVNDDYNTKPIDASKGAVLDILANDKVNNGVVNKPQVSISIVDTNGIVGVTVDAQGKVMIPAGTPVGTYVLTYTICDLINPSNCATATITIVVKDPCDFDDSSSSCDILVHNAFSPNNDGTNEVFVIERLENYPDNSVEIYNRWGILVFEVSGYDNTSRVFVGRSEGRVTVNKADTLPSGTYYYVVKYKKPISGKVNQKEGFLYLSK